MTSELATWPRKHYAPGGGDPFLFYVVYGHVGSSAPLSRSIYRSNGMPPGLELLSYGPHQHPEVPAGFRDGHLWEQLIHDDPQLAATVAECEHCLIMRGSPSDATTLNYLRDAVGLITYLLDNGGCAVFDPLVCRWWHPSDWRQQLFDLAAPVPRQHAAIHLSEEEDPSLTWFRTVGMRKFGRPDISVPHVAAEFDDAVVDLCNRLIEHQAFGQSRVAHNCTAHAIACPACPDPRSALRASLHTDRRAPLQIT